MQPVSALGDFVGGRFVFGTPDDEILRISPADLDDRVGTFPVSIAHVDAAIDAARAAQPAWARTPLSDRIAHVRRFGQEIAKRAEALVSLLGREIGKPTWEAKTEVAALAAKIDITVNEGLSLVRDVTVDAKLSYRFRPHGVLAVLGPFNFPLHLPHGHIVPALLTGNTVVFKPSDLAPACALVYAEAALAAGLPAGVLNVVQGRGPTGARLSSHERIDGVLFTGSQAVGIAIAQANVTRPGRMLALELGGKNAALVLADAPFEKAVHDVLWGACVTAGQRCTATSRVIVERPIAERFVEELARRARRLRIGHPTSPDIFSGPLVSEAALAKFRAGQERAAAEAEVVLASTDLTPGPRGYYVTPAIHRVRAPDPASRYQHEELFGPDLAVHVVDDLAAACAIANDSEYGLAASVFTAREETFEEAAGRLRVGCVNWNAPTAGSSSRLPFGGVGASGNHRPAALFSPLYCAYPVAVSKGSPMAPENPSPGMGWGAGRD